MRKKVTLQFLLVISLIIVGTTAGGIVYATQQVDEGNVIWAAYQKVNGMLRIIHDPSEARPSEEVISWNIEGSQGEQGSQGEPGPQGPQGPQGEPAPQGVIDFLQQQIDELKDKVVLLEDLLNNYAITATATEGGTISPFGVILVNNGQDQTFTITPDDGYHILDVLVDGSPVGAVNTYTFTNVNADHTISATFAADSVLPEGLVLWYPMDEGGGSIVHDNSEFGNDGIITGATWKGLPSGLWYLDFDGTDDKVNLGDPTSLLLGTGDYALFAWIKVPSVSARNTIYWRYYGGIGIWLEVQADGTIRHYTRDATHTTDNAISSSVTVDDDMWHFVTAVRNGNFLYCYVDATDEQSINSGTANVTGNAGDWLLGLDSSNTNDFKGGIALNRIFNKALSALEIQNHYNQERHLFGY